MNGPDFTVDNMDSVKAEAKVIAIKKAQAKAEEEASALGVSLGSIISFSEDAGGYTPMMYRATAGMEMSKADSVSLPQGENIVKSQVTITYTIK